MAVETNSDRESKHRSRQAGNITEPLLKRVIPDKTQILPQSIRLVLRCVDNQEAFKAEFRHANRNMVIFLLIHFLRSVYKELHADHETGAADNK